VAKILAALLMLKRGEQTKSALRIVLAAPTGKAAARLSESLAQASKNLPLTEQEVAYIPRETLTLHRLLGAQADSRFFRHNAHNPLHLDVLIVDEASMVDLTLMASLVEALPPHSHLILLGDRDQLASVEAGSVLGDLCQFAN